MILPIVSWLSLRLNLSEFHSDYWLMREYDVTPQEQGSDCIYQAVCRFYKYGIWCNECTQRLDFDDVECSDDE